MWDYGRSTSKPFPISIAQELEDSSLEVEEAEEEEATQRPGDGAGGNGGQDEDWPAWQSQSGRGHMGGYIGRWPVMMVVIPRVGYR